MDRLISVTKGNQKTTFVYDALNRRIFKNDDVFIWDDKNEIGRMREGKIEELRILGEGLGAEIGAACFLILGKETYIPIHDHSGSLVSLVDLKGKQREAIRYTAFGEELSQTHLSPWRFLSKRVDEETGLSYFGRRYYSATLGRWITPDPLGLEEGPNLYAYVQNNPLMTLDLYGEWALWNGFSHGARMSFNALFPALNELSHLPSEAPTWQRATLSGLAALEMLTCAMPAAKVGLTLAERSIYQISTAAGRTATRKGIGLTADKAMEVAAKRKVLEKSVSRAENGLQTFEKTTREGARFKGSQWKFPENPAELLKELSRDSKGRIYPSDNLRIRPEKHALKPGETFNPRHHGQHYHVESRRDPGSAWRPHNTYKVKPNNYKSREGTGFLPGEYYPGIEN